MASRVERTRNPCTSAKGLRAPDGLAVDSRGSPRPRSGGPACAHPVLKKDVGVHEEENARCPCSIHAHRDGRRSRERGAGRASHARSGGRMRLIAREGHPLIVTNRNLVVRVLVEASAPVGDFTTFGPRSSSGVHDTIETASACMRAHGIRRLPIAGCAVGIVTAERSARLARPRSRQHLRGDREPVRSNRPPLRADEVERGHAGETCPRPLPEESAATAWEPMRALGAEYMVVTREREDVRDPLVVRPHGSRGWRPPPHGDGGDLIHQRHCCRSDDRRSRPRRFWARACGRACTRSG